MKTGRKEKGTDMALVDNDIATIFAYLREHQKVSIAGLGIFEVVKIKPRTLFHNTGKKTITTTGYNKLKFTPTKTLKSYIQ